MVWLIVGLIVVPCTRDEEMLYKITPCVSVGR